jgi:hypothetical protein
LTQNKEQRRENPSSKVQALSEPSPNHVHTMSKPCPNLAAAGRSEGRRIFAYEIRR